MTRIALPKTSPGLVAALALLVATGCVKTVDGNSDSGKDYRYKGAKKIKLDEDGEGRSKRDVITYPGGDRVDWKEFTLPEGAYGTLKIRLRWKSPRPGKDLSFDVYDEYYSRIAQAKPSKKGKKKSKKVTIKGAEAGKYFVMVYASERDDAGTYRVEVRFKPGDPNDEEGGVVQSGPSDIPDPPVLSAIPDGSALPPGGVPGGTPGGVPGGTPGGVPGGTPGGVPGGPGTGPDTPEVAAKPVPARVVKYQLSGGAVLITVDRGKNAGVDRGWKGQIVSTSGRPVQGGEFTVTKVTGAESAGKVSLSVDQVKANKRVILTPP